MPVVLVLFAIALVITFVGLFLSSKSQPRHLQDDYAVVPRSKSIIRAAPAPGHARTRWAEMAESDAAMMPLKIRASRTQAQVQALQLQPARPRVVKRAAVDVIDAGFWSRLSSWKVTIPVLVALFLLSFYFLNAAGPHPLLWSSVFFGPQNQPSAPASTTVSQTYAASKHLARLGQLDPKQYSSTQEYNAWSYSACSAASMTEVINAYGHNYRITDILSVESKIHEITTKEGLLEESGIQHTGAQFGFKTTWGHNLSLDQVIAAANRGTPVIISFPPAKFAGGHILVVRGGDASTVDLADSSGLNWTQLTRARFMQLWGGFSAIMTPN
jgi:hypothetical protein